MTKGQKLSRGERIGALILTIAMTTAVVSVAYSKGVFSRSEDEYAPVPVEYSDSAAAVSRRDSAKAVGRGPRKSQAGKDKSGKKNSATPKPRKGRSRDILDESPLQ